LKSLAGAKTRLEIAQAQAFVRNHLGETIYLAGVCREIGLSTSHFSTLFRKETGMKFFDFVNRLRVAEAKKLLEKTSASILEIALTCGFETLSHFNRVYRKLEGHSPAEFRKLKS
ncbi:MAG: helix-turn-helix transcriptional regulator, partial [Spirochaetia bacterium]|nr:helix-turn-helix transcriptional regulator [Spirochaetia bacterium]